MSFRLDVEVDVDVSVVVDVDVEAVVVVVVIVVAAVDGMVVVITGSLTHKAGSFLRPLWQVRVPK